MKYFVGILFCCFALYAFADEPSKFPRIVADPYAAFIATDEDFSLSDRIREIHYDFNADGIQDTAFTDTIGCGHRGNCSWDLFIRLPDDRFLEVGFITYRLHLKVLSAKGGGSYIHTFTVGSQGHDAINSYRLTASGLKSLPDESIYIEDKDDIRRLEQLFGSGAPKELDSKDYTTKEFVSKIHTNTTEQGAAANP
jgi:hypothetical protein